VLSLFTGCNLVGTVDSLLKPPSLSQEQQQIYLALQDAVGSDITLQYPRAGENLSAFTVADLDGDGEDEALVFYKKTSLTAAENGLRLSVLDQLEDGWRSVCDSPAEGSEIERVVVSALGGQTKNRIFIGYTGVDQSDKLVTCYSYIGDDLTQEFSSSYTMFDVADLDGDESRELLILCKTTDTAAASAAVYEKTDTDIREAGKLELHSSYTDYSQILYGTLSDGSTGIYLDGATGTSTLQTEVLQYQEGVFASVLTDSTTVANTARSVGYLSMDIDGDGSVEIPVQEPFPGYSSDASEQVRLTRWLGVSEGTLVELERSYVSLSDGCIFLLPSAWYDTVTAKSDPLTGDIVFYRYAGTIDDSTIELCRYGVAEDSEEQAEREADGYQLLHTRGKAAYYLRIEETGDSLSISWEEALARVLYF
jgi:hypothetical protein